MSTANQALRKFRRERIVGRYVANPAVALLRRLGVRTTFATELQTMGRKSGDWRSVPVSARFRRDRRMGDLPARASVRVGTQCCRRPESSDPAGKSMAKRYCAFRPRRRPVGASANLCDVATAVAPRDRHVPGAAVRSDQRPHRLRGLTLSVARPASADSSAHRGTTVMAHRGPFALGKRASAVTRAQSNCSARATYIASYAVTADRSSQMRSRRGEAA